MRRLVIGLTLVSEGRPMSTAVDHVTATASPRRTPGLRAAARCSAPATPSCRRRRCCMFDRITAITADGGAHGKGRIEAEFDIIRDLWFFDCHFIGDPVMPGCLGLDAMWQLVGFFLGWIGGQAAAARSAAARSSSPARSRPGQEGHLQDRHEAGDQPQLVMGIGDGVLEADGKPIYEAKTCGSGCSTQRTSAEPGKGVCMRRVVVTGIGIVSSIGNNANEVLASLREARTGVVAAPEYAELGFRCQVHAAPQIDWESHGRPQGRALPGAGHGLRPHRHGAGDRRLRPRARPRSATSAPA